jgi:hypothetical protein
MQLLHFILNVAALLLWVNWRGMGFKEYVPYRSTLVHTLRSAEQRPLQRWRYLFALAGLLAVRGILYEQVGAALKWVPVIDLGVLTLPFRSDQPWRMMLYSVLGFGVFWLGFQLCLLLLSVVNRSTPDTQTVQHLVRLHLGPVERWPVALKLCLPPLAGLLLWLPVHPLLATFGLLPSATTLKLVAEQGLVLGLALFLVWKNLVLGILLVHLLNSYVYLGRSPFLDLASDTARHLLTVLAWLPLRWGRIDFAPVVLGLIVWFAAWGYELGLLALFRKLPL